MKQSNWYLIFNYLILLKLILGSNNFLGLSHSSQNLNFGAQKSNSQILQAANRPDSHARIYANRYSLIQLQLAAEQDLLAQLAPEDSNQTINTSLPIFKIPIPKIYANLKSQARAQAHREQLALELIQDYNSQLDRRNRLANTIASYEINLPEQFFNTKFSNSAQQLLHQQQLHIVYELADPEIFPRDIMGIQDFSNTVLETVALAYQANRRELIQISENFTNLAQAFLAFGRGLKRGGYNFVSNISNASSNLILHPINTTKTVANNIAKLTKNVTLGLFKILIFLADTTDEHNPEGARPYILAAQDYGHARYAQFRNYITTVPRDQKLEQAGTLISEQLLNLTASFLTGKTVALISDSVITAQLHQAIKLKNKADKVKSKQINWLNKFGTPGKDVSRTLGLAVTEEYELAELNGLVTSFKNSPTNNQTLFNHAEEYFKHNKSGKKAKRTQTAVKETNNVIKLCPASCSKQYESLKTDFKKLEFTSTINVTDHGLQRLIERDFQPKEVLALITNPDYQRIQADGANVFIIKNLNNKYNIISINKKAGEVITALKNISLKSLENLGRKYGWKL